MARKTVLSVRVIAAVVAFVAQEPVNVSRVCREAGTSRKSFYKWVDRYRTEGLAGLEERSRRPKTTPGRTPSEIEDAVVACRASQLARGLDAGALSIQSALYASPAIDNGQVPSISTVYRILVRRGLVTPQPRKRPKSSWRRFEAGHPNERWQIDATEWVIATGTIQIFNIIDDHSRVLTRSRAVTNATTGQAWTTFCQATQAWGMPVGVLSDNGLCFSGKLRGVEVYFEAQLRDAGVRPITGRPYHPQTTGKVERFQQTLKKWLRRQPLAADIDALQTQLDEFAQIYNHERPHQGIGRVTPASRWLAGTPATPDGTPLEHPTKRAARITKVTVCSAGKINYGRYQIGLGIRHHGQTATIIGDGNYASIYINEQLIRHLRIDPTRRYQPNTPHPIAS